MPAAPQFDQNKLDELKKQQQEKDAELAKQLQSQQEAEMNQKKQQQLTDEEIAKKLASEEDLEETPPAYSPPTLLNVQPNVVPSYDTAKGPENLDFPPVPTEKIEIPDKPAIPAAENAVNKSQRPKSQMVRPKSQKVDKPPEPVNEGRVPITRGNNNCSVLLKKYIGKKKKITTLLVG